MKTLQSLIIELSNSIILRERPDGTQFYAQADNVSEYVSDLCHYVHDGMMPDDYRYKFLSETLDNLTTGDADSLEELMTNEYDCYEIIEQPDVMNHDLLTWQSSNLGRMGYADQVLSDLEPASLSNLLQMAQEKERVEVLDLIVDWLQEKQFELWEEVA